MQNSCFTLYNLVHFCQLWTQKGLIGTQKSLLWLSLLQVGNKLVLCRFGIHLETIVWHWVSSSIILPFIFWGMVSTEPGAQLDYLGVRAQGSSSLLLHSARISGVYHPPCLSLCVSAKDLNSDRQASTASTLTTKPSPEPLLWVTLICVLPPIG